MTDNRPFMESEQIDSLISKMAEQLRDRLKERRIDAPIMIGIHTGGVWLAQHLHKELGLKEPLGVLDISFYRDDFTRIGMNPEVRPSDLPVPVDDRHILLIDDVLETGRTIRAALNEIFDYGRPSSVQLITLIEKSGRELPIQPDVVGLRLELAAGERITLTGPSPLALVISRQSNRNSRKQQAGL